VRRFVAAVVAGVLVQGAVLATFRELPPSLPPTSVTAFRVFFVGVLGGYVAARFAVRRPRRAAVAAGASAGVGVGAAFWWAVLYGDTVGVVRHLHYALATAGVPGRLIRDVPRLVVATAALAVAAAFALGGTLGGWMATAGPD